MNTFTAKDGAQIYYKNATLRIYSGSSHGLCTVEKDRVNAELLAFVEA